RDLGETRRIGQQGSSRQSADLSWPSGNLHAGQLGDLLALLVGHRLQLRRLGSRLPLFFLGWRLFAPLTRRRLSLLGGGRRRRTDQVPRRSLHFNAADREQVSLDGLNNSSDLEIITRLPLNDNMIADLREPYAGVRE